MLSIPLLSTVPSLITSQLIGIIQEPVMEFVFIKSFRRYLLIYIVSAADTFCQCNMKLLLVTSICEARLTRKLRKAFICILVNMCL